MGRVNPKGTKSCKEGLTMIVTKGRWLTTADVWFNEPRNDHPVDVVRYHQAQAPVPGSLCTPFHTLVIDLGRSESELLANIHKDTRYEIRRAREKDGVTSGAWNGKDNVVLDQFLDLFNTFTQQKGLPKLDSHYFRDLAAAGCLDISWASTPDKKIIVYHTHIVVAGRARLQHSASLFRASSSSEFRNLVGRANRFLHWEDISRFKSNGIVTYDFGGWYEGSEDAEKLRINTFKEGFGGRKIMEFNCKLLVTLKAKAVMALSRLRKRWAAK
jgi:lipid II:glycine glycyltransferase (peptidoglycan interpeptide bridge formation enzyme)